MHFCALSLGITMTYFCVCFPLRSSSPRKKFFLLGARGSSRNVGYIVLKHYPPGRIGRTSIYREPLAFETSLQYQKIVWIQTPFDSLLVTYAGGFGFLRTHFLQQLGARRLQRILKIHR